MANEKQFVNWNYLAIAAGLIVVVTLAIAVKLGVEDRHDWAMTEEMDTTQSELLGIGSKITSIKDADLTTPNDFIAAYAPVEPLEKEYDQKLAKYTQLYNAMRERDGHRSLLDLQRWRGTHHPKTGEQMSVLISLVQQINDITKREISVVHAMASLPEPERA